MSQPFRTEPVPEPVGPAFSILSSASGGECFVCCLHAVIRGVDYSGDGRLLSDGTKMHDPVTALAGTPVCWYHVTHVASGGGLSQKGASAVEALREERPQL